MCCGGALPSPCGREQAVCACRPGRGEMKDVPARNCRGMPIKGRGGRRHARRAREGAVLWRERPPAETEVRFPPPGGRGGVASAKHGRSSFHDPSGRRHHRRRAEGGVVARARVPAQSRAEAACPPRRAPHIVSSMIALTMSPSLILSALTALARETPAWLITSSTSFGSTPVSSTSPSSPPISSMTGFVTFAISGLFVITGSLNCSAAACCACAERSSILASPKMM
mmetsp:Transcript_16271/g.48287  ORF Transcript_16271/g.48287 Transcript_16271/m.48287 type:complete len:227 (-) Transcript_16271:331-1011(-)